MQKWICDVCERDHNGKVDRFLRAPQAGLDICAECKTKITSVVKDGEELGINGIARGVVLAAFREAVGK